MPDQLNRQNAHSPEYALLGFLYEQPAHGYDLHQRLISELGQVWRVSQSQTYSILKRLATQGYLTATTQEQRKLPPRQLLRITAAGRHRFDAWLAAPTGSSVHAIRLEFITRLYFAQKISPKKIQPMLETQLAEISAAIAQLETRQATIPAEQIFNRLSLHLRIQQLKSVLEWLMECREVFPERNSKK